jgi:two-component sensor histidine kinase
VAPLQRLYDFEVGRVGASVTSISFDAEYSRLLMIAAGAIAALTLLYLSIGWRREVELRMSAKDEEIEALRERRSALVREVHHRIKNHLQGLLGLIENLRGREREDNAALATVHGHVVGMISSHGLQSRSLGGAIGLDELVRQQIRLIQEGFPGAQLDLRVDGEGGPASLSAEQSLPIALVVTELIVNAIKHGEPAPVRVTLLHTADSACVAVTNLAKASARFDWLARQGLGTGLELVSSLLEGVGRIAQSAGDSEITMTLQLEARGA